jgi:hypothetical protein
MTIRVRKSVATLFGLFFFCLPSAAQEREFPPLPPLNDPPTELRLPGKFVWADLFTTDIAKARSFYTGLFGWDWRQVSSARPYGMFYQDDIAVSGLALRDPPDEGQAYGTWVYYASVDDVASVETAVAGRGGEALLPRRSMPERGEFAILADPDGAIIGVLRSSSGDPGEFQAAVGEFIWYQLFTSKLDPATEFYQTVFGYDVYENEDTPELLDYMLSSQGYSRAGVGLLPEDSESVPTWVGFVRVENVAASVAEAERLGGKVLLPPAPERLGGDIAIVADPEGTPVGLLRWTYPETEEDEQ